MSSSGGPIQGKEEVHVDLQVTEDRVSVGLDVAGSPDPEPTDAAGEGDAATGPPPEVDDAVSQEEEEPPVAASHIDPAQAAEDEPVAAAGPAAGGAVEIEEGDANEVEDEAEQLEEAAAMGEAEEEEEEEEEEEDEEAAADRAMPGKADDHDPLPAYTGEKVLRVVHGLRVKYLRATKRMCPGMPEDFLKRACRTTLRAVGLVERKHVPYSESVKKKVQGADPIIDAETLASSLESKQRKGRLDFNLRVMVVGKPGAGKSELINSLAGKRLIHTDPFRPPSGNARTVKAEVDGVGFTFLEAPGIRFSEDAEAVKKLAGKFRPDVVLYVERADMGTPSDADAELMSALFGAGEGNADPVIHPDQVMLVLGHAGKAAMDPAVVEAWYEVASSAGRGGYVPWAAAECHPQCLRSDEGLACVFISLPEGQEELEASEAFSSIVDMLSEELSKVPEGAEMPNLVSIPWRSLVLMHVLQLGALAGIRDIVLTSWRFSPDSAAVRLRALPPVEYFIEDMMADVDGMPEPWDTKDVPQALQDPYDFYHPTNPHIPAQEAKAAKEDSLDWARGYSMYRRLFGPDTNYDDIDPAFDHMYLATMRKLAKQGDPLARREYDRFKLRYNNALVNNIIFVDPNLAMFDYGLAQWLQSLPLHKYIELGQVVERSSIPELQDYLKQFQGSDARYAMSFAQATKEKAAAGQGGQAAGATAAVAVAQAPQNGAKKAAAAPPTAAASAKAKVEVDDEEEDEDEDDDEAEEDEEEQEGGGEEKGVEADAGDDDAFEAGEAQGEGPADAGGEEGDEGMEDEEGYSGPSMGGIAQEINFGDAFDMPAHAGGHRFRVFVGDQKLPLPFVVSYEQDYYRYERDNGVTGTGITIDFDHETSLLRSMSIGGMPIGGKLDLNFSKESKDVSGLLYTSMYHSAPPFGPKHVSEAFFEFQSVLPYPADTFYSLEMNTYRKSLWGWSPAGNCPPSMGVVMTRMAENGNPFTGPCGVGLRGQANVVAGGFDLLFMGSKMNCYAPNGQVDEGWSLEVDVLQPFVKDLDLDITFFGFNKDAQAARKLGIDVPKGRLRSYGCQAQASWSWDVADSVSDWSCYWQLGRAAVLLECALQSDNPLWALVGLLPTISLVRYYLPYWRSVLGRGPGALRRIIGFKAAAAAGGDRAERQKKLEEMERKREEEARLREAMAAAAGGVTAAAAGAEGAVDLQSFTQQLQDIVSSLHREEQEEDRREEQALVEEEEEESEGADEEVAPEELEEEEEEVVETEEEEEEVETEEEEEVEEEEEYVEVEGDEDEEEEEEEGE